MKKLKKSLLLITAISLLSTFTAFGATDSTSSNSVEYVKDFISAYHNKNIDVKGHQELLDASGENTFTCIRFTADSQEGFAIVDNVAMCVTEIYFDKAAPFSENDTITYTGPFGYFITDGNAFYSIMDETNVTELSLAEATLELRAENSQTVYNPETSLLKTAKASSKTISGAGSSSWAYASGNIVGDCGINAVAMQLKWYDIYVSSNYLSNSYNSEANIKNGVYNYCISHGLPTKFWENELATALVGFSQTAGINGTYLYAESKLPDWSTVTRVANSNRPLILSTNSNTPTYGTHYVISVGYNDTGSVTSNQVYCNDGWGKYAWINFIYVQKMVETV